MKKSIILMITGITVVLACPKGQECGCKVPTKNEIGCYGKQKKEKTLKELKEKLSYKIIKKEENVKNLKECLQAETKSELGNCIKANKPMKYKMKNQIKKEAMKGHCNKKKKCMDRMNENNIKYKFVKRPNKMNVEENFIQKPNKMNVEEDFVVFPKEE